MTTELESPFTQILTDTEPMKAGKLPLGQRLRGLVSIAGAPRVDGVDTSKWQGAMNVGQVLASTPSIFWWGMRVYDRSTGRADVNFEPTRQATAALPYRLFYDFLNDTENPTVQANRFCDIVGSLGPGEGAMCDAEGNSTEERAWEWCTVVESRLGKPSAVYTGVFVNGGRIWRSTRLFNGSRARIVAAYTTEERMQQLTAPFPAHAWQFSSTGRLPGIAGNVDLDQVNDRAAFDRVCAAPPPPPPEWAPLQHKYADYPTRPKPDVHFGDGYAVHTELRDLITYAKLVMVIEAGQNTWGSSWFVWELYGIAAMQNIQRFFGLTVRTDGVLDAPTWAVIDFLAGPRPR